MAVTGWKSCGTVSTTPSPGDAEDWDNAGSEYYTLGIYIGTSLTGNLILKNFGFTTTDIPSGSTIDGVEFELEKKQSNGNVEDNSIKLTTDGSSGTGTDQSKSGYWATSFTQYTYGGSSSTWGVSLTDTQVRSSNFGVVIQAKLFAYDGYNYAYVETTNDTAQITQIRVYYTPLSTSTGVHYRTSSGWEEISKIHYRTSGGWEEINQVSYRTSSGWEDMSG